MPFNSVSKGTARVGAGHRVLGRISARERDSPAVLDETRRCGSLAGSSPYRR